MLLVMNLAQVQYYSASIRTEISFKADRQEPCGATGNGLDALIAAEHTVNLRIQRPFELKLLGTFERVERKVRDRKAIVYQHGGDHVRNSIGHKQCCAWVVPYLPRQ
jgi:hypothetical protein